MLLSVHLSLAGFGWRWGKTTFVSCAGGKCCLNPLLAASILELKQTADEWYVSTATAGNNESYNGAELMLKVNTSKFIYG